MSRTTESIRWRGGQVTRIEALTDAVFGFAITLLVVRLDVPLKADDLLAMMKEFVPFALSFALLILVWSYHYRLFSRFDLEDGYTVFLNSVLLFVILFYVYPLKFVFKAILLDPAATFGSPRMSRTIMSVYGAGFSAVFLVFALLYLHAYRLRFRLNLKPSEIIMAQAHVAECCVMVAAGVFSVGVALFGPAGWSAPLSGMSYFLIGPAQWYVGSRYGRLQTIAEEREQAAAPLQPV
jgi:uncharacterized membrane protein